MSNVPFVLTEQDEDGDWELAGLEPEAEATQLAVVLSVPEPVEDGSSPASNESINWATVASEVETMLALDSRAPDASKD